jgi:hypothetical protein
MLAIAVLCKIGLTLERAVAVWVRAGKINHGGWRITEKTGGKSAT